MQIQNPRVFHLIPNLAAILTLSFIQKTKNQKNGWKLRQPLLHNQRTQVWLATWNIVLSKWRYCNTHGISLQCRRFLWVRNLLSKAPCWNFPKRGGAGASQGSGKGARREKRKRRIFFLPSPSPLSFFRPRTYRKGYYFYSPQSSTVIKSKMVATTILRTRTRFCPPKIRLHCRLTRNVIILITIL